MHLSPFRSRPRTLFESTARTRLASPAAADFLACGVGCNYRLSLAGARIRRPDDRFILSNERDAPR